MSNMKKIPVTISQGTVLGIESKLPERRNYYAFKGIPYAEPPVDDLRFQPPIALKKFTKDPLECVEERSISIQNDRVTNKLIGSEDCLFLNVYTPLLHGDKLLPVMVWIHGGAFLMGSGDSSFFSPVHLIKEDVVVVTFNYRLSMFGFLYLPNADVPGNVGLMDQLLVLKWVKENIAHFKGDPKNVTLFGQSSGGASVHLHLLSPNSKPYFHKAICQSGTSTMDWVIQIDPEGKARKLAELLGFESNSDIEILEFLKQQPASEIHKFLYMTLTPEEKRRGIYMAYRPVIESGSDNPKIVLKSPLAAYMESNTIEIPVMMGVTSNEGLSPLSHSLKRLKEVNEDLGRLVPSCIKLTSTDPLYQGLVDEVRQFYFNGQEMSKENLNEASHLFNDCHFNIDINLCAEIHARKQHKSPLYVYMFSYNGDLNLFKTWSDMNELDGVFHSDDLFYLFQMDFEDAVAKPGSTDERIRNQMCRMWTNFAKYGNPTPTGDSTLNFKWNSVKHIGMDEDFVLDYLNIDKESRMEKNPHKKRIDFWRNIFKKYKTGFLEAKL